MQASQQHNAFLHVMLRVKDLDQSLHFYTHYFGLKVLRKQDYPGGKFTLAFLGFNAEADSTVIELTHNWEQDRYEKGNAFGHLAFGVPDITTFCSHLQQDGIRITRAPGPMAHDNREIIAFIEDPDGYAIEIKSLT